MFYLYAKLRGTQDCALIRESTDMKYLYDGMQHERICWSDDGLDFMLADHLCSTVLTYEEICERVMK